MLVDVWLQVFNKELGKFCPIATLLLVIGPGGLFIYSLILAMVNRYHDTGEMSRL